jgi:hypothetical protein
MFYRRSGLTPKLLEIPGVKQPLLEESPGRALPRLTQGNIFWLQVEQFLSLFTDPDLVLTNTRR